MIDNADPTIMAMMLLFPLAAVMVVFQANPYHALVTRGILGAVAALIYALVGAADVALTEALVGTMLAITLYAVAVRSSLVMRLGVLQDLCQAKTQGASGDPVIQGHFAEMTEAYRQMIAPYHLRLELVPYADADALITALNQREVHGICRLVSGASGSGLETLIRVRRLFEILQAGLTPTLMSWNQLEFVSEVDRESKVVSPENLGLPEELP